MFLHSARPGINKSRTGEMEKLPELMNFPTGSRQTERYYVALPKREREIRRLKDDKRKFSRSKKLV